MKQMAIAAVVVVCSLAGAGCASERYAHHGRDWHARADTLDMMTKDDVIALSNAGVSDGVIIDQIKTTRSYFQLNTQDIVDLANAGVSDKVMSAMIKTDEAAGQSTGGYYGYYPPWYWYADYPFVYPWYPSFFLGFSLGHHRPFFGHGYHAPRFGGHGAFYGGHGSFGGGRGSGGFRSGGRHR